MKATISTNNLTEEQLEEVLLLLAYIAPQRPQAHPIPQPRPPDISSSRSLRSIVPLIVLQLRRHPRAHRR